MEGWADSPSPPTTRGSTRPGTGRSSRSQRVEALMTSRMQVAERCAESARQWQEASYKPMDEEQRFSFGQSVPQPLWALS